MVNAFFVLVLTFTLASGIYFISIGEVFWGALGAAISTIGIIRCLIGMTEGS